MSASAQAGAVYVAFLAAASVTSPGRFGAVTISVGAVVATIAALATVVLRDAWASQRPRAGGHLALDAVLALTCVAAVHAALRMLDVRFALEPVVVLTGVAIGVPLLTGLRLMQRAPLMPVDSTASGGDVMSVLRPGPSREMQRDLHRWWWAIAAVGFTAGVGLLVIPAAGPIRPLVVAWLAFFAGIGIYQRRWISWPQRPQPDATGDRLSRYRAALERRRDEQTRWPAGHLRWIMGVVTVAFLLSLVHLFVPRGDTPTAIEALSPLAVACGAFALFAMLAALILYFVAGMLGIGMAYHRLLTHRSYRTPKLVEYFLTLCGTLALEGGPIFWVATHRVHHQKSDREGDPHTPREGTWWSHMGWILLGQGLHHDASVLSRYAPDLAVR